MIRRVSLAAVLLGACSGAVPRYATSLAPSPELSVISGDDSMRIIAYSRRASSASGGWASVRISERVRRAVDQLADRLASGPSRSGDLCAPVLVRPIDELARQAGPDGKAWSSGIGR